MDPALWDASAHASALQGCLCSAECRLNQNVFAGPHAAPVTAENLNTINALAARLTELSQDHNELRARV